MELEQQLRDFDRRLDEGRQEIRARIERVERCCRESEEARRRDWEELEGRMMTAEEERKHQSDGILRLMTAMTAEYVNIMRAFGEDMRQEFARGRAEAEEGRAQLRANTEAVLKMLDRLPPKSTN